MKPIISIERIGKSYTIQHRAKTDYKSLRDEIYSIPQKIIKKQKKAKEEFWALKDVSFDIMPGTRVGIIGRNGAGKSTLLKLLSRITVPTTGRIILRGRIASLLEVGTGFHPELTGRENIFLNGAILGMSRIEVHNKFDEIVDFAGIENFLDTPVKRYSSGMYVRLAFAVAAHLESEILVVDEVLAVGDAEFQKKCLGKMDAASKDGRTVLFVSHNMGVIKHLCSRVILLNSGCIAEDSCDVSSAIKIYMADSEDNINAQWVNSGKEFLNDFFTPLQLNVTKSEQDNSHNITIVGKITTVHSGLQVGVSVYDENEQLLFWTFFNDRPEDEWPTLDQGIYKFSFTLPQFLLNSGRYRIDLISAIYYQEWLCQPGGETPRVRVVVQDVCSGSPYWRETRPGCLAPLFFWDVKRENEP